MVMLGAIVLTRAMLALWTANAYTATTAPQPGLYGMPEGVPAESDDLSSASDGVAMSAPAETGSEPSGESALRGNRDGKGRFAKGHTGNAGGRPKADKTSSLTKTLDGSIDRRGSLSGKT